MLNTAEYRVKQLAQTFQRSISLTLAWLSEIVLATNSRRCCNWADHRLLQWSATKYTPPRGYFPNARLDFGGYTLGLAGLGMRICSIWVC